MTANDGQSGGGESLDLSRDRGSKAPDHAKTDDVDMSLDPIAELESLDRDLERDERLAQADTPRGISDITRLSESREYTSPTVEDYYEYGRFLAKKYDVPVEILMLIIKIETGYKMTFNSALDKPGDSGWKARGGKYDIAGGATQMIPGTGRGYSLRVAGFKKDDLDDSYNPKLGYFTPSGIDISAKVRQYPIVQMDDHRYALGADGFFHNLDSNNRLIADTYKFAPIDERMDLWTALDAMAQYIKNAYEKSKSEQEKIDPYVPKIKVGSPVLKLAIDTYYGAKIGAKEASLRIPGRTEEAKAEIRGEISRLKSYATNTKLFVDAFSDSASAIRANTAIQYNSGSSVLTHLEKLSKGDASSLFGDVGIQICGYAAHAQTHYLPVEIGLEQYTSEEYYVPDKYEVNYPAETYKPVTLQDFVNAGINLLDLLDLNQSLLLKVPLSEILPKSADGKYEIKLPQRANTSSASRRFSHDKYWHVADKKDDTLTFHEPDKAESDRYHTARTTDNEIFSARENEYNLDGYEDMWQLTFQDIVNLGASPSEVIVANADKIDITKLLEVAIPDGYKVNLPAGKLQGGFRLDVRSAPSGPRQTELSPEQKSTKSRLDWELRKFILNETHDKDSNPDAGDGGKQKKMVKDLKGQYEKDLGLTSSDKRVKEIGLLDRTATHFESNAKDADLFNRLFENRDLAREWMEFCYSQSKTIYEKREKGRIEIDDFKFVAVTMTFFDVASRQLPGFSNDDFRKLGETIQWYEGVKSKALTNVTRIKAAKELEERNLYAPAGAIYREVGVVSADALDYALAILDVAGKNEPKFTEIKSRLSEDDPFAREAKEKISEELKKYPYLKSGEVTKNGDLVEVPIILSEDNQIIAYAVFSDNDTAKFTIEHLSSTGKSRQSKWRADGELPEAERRSNQDITQIDPDNLKDALFNHLYRKFIYNKADDSNSSGYPKGMAKFSDSFNIFTRKNNASRYMLTITPADVMENGESVFIGSIDIRPEANQPNYIRVRSFTWEDGAKVKEERFFGSINAMQKGIEAMEFVRRP